MWSNVSTCIQTCLFGFPVMYIMFHIKLNKSFTFVNRISVSPNLLQEILRLCCDHPGCRTPDQVWFFNRPGADGKTEVHRTGIEAKTKAKYI